MDGEYEHLRYNGRVASLREYEYPMLQSTTYLDHAGTTLCSRSLIDAFSKENLSSIIGNPHSASFASQQTAQKIDDIRVRVLRFFQADPDYFDLVFVSNATAAIKLVGDAFRDHPRGFWYGYHKDAHTSLVGLRELATRGSHCFISDEEVDCWLNSAKKFLDATPGPTLFAYPGQSNMNGRRLPLNWPCRSRSSGIPETYTLFDAAALAATTPLNLHDPDRAPDFIALSFYKLFGFPELGALIVHNRAAHIFQYRRYFGGGTVEVVSCLEEQWYEPKSTALHARIEDGSLPVRSILALGCAVDCHEKLYGSQAQVSQHTSFLATRLYNQMSRARHGNGKPVFTFYQEPESSHQNLAVQGPIIAFNVMDADGNFHSCYEFNKLAGIQDIHIRTGTLCNPGGVAASLGISAKDLRDSFDSGVRCGEGVDLRDGRPNAMARVSFGASSTLQDVDRFMEFIEEFFVESALDAASTEKLRDLTAPYYIESITIYPIKSCRGWQVPAGHEWPLRAEGLAWDRQWCLLHQGTRAYLSQKRCPRMALLQPTLDFTERVLRIDYKGMPNKSVPLTITVPLAEDLYVLKNGFDGRRKGSDDTGLHPLIYTDSSVTQFFTAHLGMPCYLARIPSFPAIPGIEATNLTERDGSIALNSRQPSKTLRMPGAFPTPPPSPPSIPRSLSNDSPLLAITRVSLDYLNSSRVGDSWSTTSTKQIPELLIEPESFRANILLAATVGKAENGIGHRPFEEESWQRMKITRRFAHGETAGPGPSKDTTWDLTVLGPCRRCQMICIDQQNGSKISNPFTDLARLRRGEGSVCFGIHCVLPLRPGQHGPSEVRIRTGDFVEGISSFKY